MSINILGGCTHCHTIHSCLLYSSFVTKLKWKLVQTLIMSVQWMVRQEVRFNQFNFPSGDWFSCEVAEKREGVQMTMYVFSLWKCQCEQWHCPWLHSMFVQKPNINACGLTFPDGKDCQTLAHSEGDGSMQ